MTVDRSALPLAVNSDAGAPWWWEFYDDLLADVVLVRSDGGERELRFLIAAHVRFYGSVAGEPLGPDSPRCLVLGTRAERDRG